MAAESSPAFQFYVKEWRSSRPIMRMTFAQRGMYLEMLLEQWENLSLPDSPEECADIIGGSAKVWRKNWPALRRNFLVVDGEPTRIKNTRLEKERHKQKSRSKRATDQAQVAARARWNKGLDSQEVDAPSIPPASHEHAPSMHADAIAFAIPITTSDSVLTHTPPTTPKATTRPRPIIAKRRLDAAWEGARGLYVPQRLHRQFVETRNGDERGVLAFYDAVADAYSEGPRKSHEPGSDMFKFWSARYDEKWPATAPEKPQADTGPRYVSSKEHPYAEHYRNDMRPTGTEGPK